MRYLFADFEMNVDQRSLARGGSTVATEPKVFDVLLYLIENRDRAVSRDELLEACWQGVYVSDGTLSRCLSRIRQALGQGRGESRPIQTLHSKGYRFVADVTSVGEDVAPELPESERLPVYDGSTLDRRFVSILHVALGGKATQTEADAERMLRASQAVLDIAASHGCAGVRLPGRELVVQVGYPNAEEQPVRVAMEMAGLIVRLAAPHEIGLRVTIASGMATIHSGFDGEDDVLLGVEPIRVVAPLEVSRPLLLMDERTRSVLQDDVIAEEATCLLPDGQERVLFRVDERSARGGRNEPGKAFFVGRDRELVHLEQLWDKARRGFGQALVISGEPGIGKTELVERFIEQLALSDDTVFRMVCSPHHSNTPLYPQLILLRDVLDLDVDTAPVRQLKVIEQFLEQFDRPAADNLPVLASLMSVTLPHRTTDDLRLDAQRRWARTMDAMIHLVLSSAERAPTLLWIDDIQWADPSTIETVSRLTEGISDRRLMVIACCRDAEAVDLGGLASARRLTLERMHRMHAIKLLTQISQQGLLPTGLIGTISERSEGIPLYLREIVRMSQVQLSEKASALDTASIPDTLQGLLASRLEATGPALPLLQWISMIGRAAPQRLLERVCQLDDAVLDSQLGTLIRSGLIQRSARGGSTEYSFDHALMRDAAYESMRVSTRRERHLVIANTLRSAFPDIAATEPEQIAIHYAASTEPSRAIAYWQAAGEASMEKNAVAEAQTMFRQALDAAQTLPEPQGGKLVAEIEAMLAAF